MKADCFGAVKGLLSSFFLSIIKGIGIREMEELSGNLGGKIIIDGSNGFSVITLLPLEGELHGN
jgi:signal transduction histidine kinase